MTPKQRANVDYILFQLRDIVDSEIANYNNMIDEVKYQWECQNIDKLEPIVDLYARLNSPSAKYLHPYVNDDYKKYDILPRLNSLKCLTTIEMDINVAREISYHVKESLLFEIVANDVGTVTVMAISINMLEKIVHILLDKYEESL